MIERLLSTSRVTEVNDAATRISGAFGESGITDAYLTTTFSAFDAANLELSKAIRRSKAESELEEKDEVRDTRVRSLYYLLNGFNHHPTAEIRQAATILLNIFDNYGLKMTGESYMFGEEQRWSKEAINDPTIYSWVMNNSWHTNYKASQEGEMNAEYSMLPHGKFDYFSAYKFGVENSQPLIPVLSNNVAKNENSLFTIKGDIVLTSLKPSRDKKFFMVRLFNPTKEKQSGTIEFQKGEAVEIFLSRADEANLGKISNRFELIPFEVLTLKIKLKKF